MNDHHSANRRKSRALRFESLEDRRVFAGLPLGAQEWDTAEYMLGRVAVTPVFLESNGQIDPNTENWTAQHKDEVMQKIQAGLQFWVDLLATQSSVHTLEWVIDTTWVNNPAPTAYEPISRRSNDYTQWVPEFLSLQGYAATNGIEQNILAFNHAQRMKLQTDWAFTIFVVNSSNDLNGLFAQGGEFTQAFAFAGGMYEVVPSTRPASTFAHETGHIFYALDEYPGGASFFDRRGYYNTQNTNAISRNPNTSFVQQPSIMSAGTSLDQAYNNLISPAATLAMIGWQDSDSDGIFDVLDVPLGLEGIGRYQPNTQTFVFRGSAFAQAMPNANTTAYGNSITLNRVTNVEYRFAGDSDWTTFSQPNLQIANLDLSIPIQASDVGRTIEIRVRDSRIGVVSEIYRAVLELKPNVTDKAGLAGFVWNDIDNDGDFDLNETGRSGFAVQLMDSNGNAVDLMESVELVGVDDGLIVLTQFPGVTLENIGFDSRLQIAVGAAQGLTGKTLKPVSLRTGRTLDGWNSDHALELTFANPVSEFEIWSRSITPNSQVLVRAYDSNGTLLYSRNASLATSNNASTLAVHDSDSKIKRVEIRPYFGSVIELGDFTFGIPTSTTTDVNGLFRFDVLPTGNYETWVLPARNDVYSYTMASDGKMSFAYSAGAVQEGLNFGVHLPRGNWTNESLPTDVNIDGKVSSLDLLQIVNSLRTFRGTLNQPLEFTQVPVGSLVDANQDGFLSSLDLLAVVNRLRENRIRGNATGEISASTIPAEIANNSAETIAWPMVVAINPFGVTISPGAISTNVVSSTVSNSRTIPTGENIIAGSVQSSTNNDGENNCENNSDKATSLLDSQYLQSVDKNLSEFAVFSVNKRICGCGMCGCS